MSFPHTCSKCSAPQSEIIGVEVRGIYDGVCYYQCGKCGHQWHRFDKDDVRRRARVEGYLAKTIPDK
jgi:hypothetical protein